MKQNKLNKDCDLSKLDVSLIMLTFILIVSSFDTNTKQINEDKRTNLILSILVIILSLALLAFGIMRLFNLVPWLPDQGLVANRTAGIFASVGSIAMILFVIFVDKKTN